MPQLSAPDVRFHRSYLAAMDEFRAAPDGTGRTLARDLTTYGDTWQDPAVFARYVAELNAATARAAAPPGWDVPATSLWWTEGDTFLGRLVLRHRLTDELLRFGGHIGYGVRPGARRRGHATAMLHACLPYARELGIDPVLVTCDASNLPSRKVIEAGGGVLEDEQQGKLRFWIPTGRRPVPDRRR